MKKIENKATIRNIVIFTVVVVLCGFIGKGLDVQMGLSSKDSLGMLLWLVMPLLTVLLLRAFAGDGWKDIGLKFFFKKNFKWYVASLLIFPFLTMLVLGLGGILGWVTFENFNTGLYFSAFVAVLLPNFLKNIPEEFVWRGYLTPKLHTLKINDFSLYLIVGLIWGAWHIPYYLFFLSYIELESVTSISRVGFIPLSIAVMIAWSIVFVELRLLTKTVWPAVIMHTIEDSFLNVLFFGGFVAISQTKEIWISPIYGFVSILLFVALGLTMRNVRLKSEGLRF